MGEKSGKTVLVTGATGQQGGAVARHLLSKGFKVRALSRKPDSDKAKALAALGAEIAEGNFDDAASVTRALQGAWGVFAVQNTWEAGVEQEEVQGKLVAKLARDAGVGHYVYTSVESAQRKTGIPHFDNKGRIEERVRELGFPSFTILRPVFFMENMFSAWFLQPSGDKVAAAMKPTTVLQMVAVEDIGKYGALAFERAEELNRAEIDIAGDALTMPAAAAVMSEALGRKIEFVELPIEAVRKNSEDFAIMLEWFDRVGYSADIAGLEKKYGIKPTTFVELARSQAKK
jgi:uncharacterized protein YbjT (DUF2867 family)